MELPTPVGVETSRETLPGSYPRVTINASFAASVAAIPGEAVPLLGTTMLSAGMSYELYAACNNMKDLDELYSDMGLCLCALIPQRD